MSDIKWIKIVTDIFDDEKMLLIETLPDADSIIVIWFKLLCLAGKQNNSGVFVLNGRMPYTDKMFATIFRRKESTVQLALKTFEEFGMIEIIEGAVTIPNWGKHQALDKIESRNAYMRNYMSDYRSKQKLLACKSNSKVNSKHNVSALEEEKEEEKNKKREEEKEMDLLGDVFQTFEKCGFQITSHSVEELTALSEEYSPEWVTEAIKRASDRGKKSIGYIKGILQRWQINGAIDDSQKPDKDKGPTEAEKQAAAERKRQAEAEAEAIIEKERQEMQGRKPEGPASLNYDFLKKVPEE